jgi:hypothetical protein
MIAHKAARKHLFNKKHLFGVKKCSTSFLFGESRAQAALVDSLFFIGIIATLCSGLFYFTVNYGLSTEKLLNSFYSSDFAMDSLKVITYVNIMRDGTAIQINDGSQTFHEYDYLLAMIKENYSKDKNVSVSTRIAIGNALYSVLKPFDDSIDYLFFIGLEGSGGDITYDAVILATHKCDSANLDDCRRGTTIPRRAFYSCDPYEKKAITKHILPYVGKVDSAVGKITLSNVNYGSSSGDSTSVGAGAVPHIIGLYTWVSKSVSVMQSPDDKQYELGCTEIPVQVKNRSN